MPLQSGLRAALAQTRVGGAVRDRVGASLRLARQIETLDRPRWLYRPSSTVPDARFHHREPAEVTAADVELCSRLVAAYTRAADRGDSRAGMWADELFVERQSVLASALHQQDPARLAAVLAAMFRSDFVVGMASGSLGTKSSSRLSRRVAWIEALGRIVALGESLGALRMENPEQGAVGVGLSEGVDAVVARIEAALGASIDFPDVGAAYGALIGGRLVTVDSPDQMYGAHRLLGAIDRHLPGGDPGCIVEIGGGYGGMAYWLWSIRQLPYVIVDLPIVNVLQGYFLSKTLGHDVVSLYGEQRAQIAVAPANDLAAVPAPFAVLANKDSMPEIPLEALRGYLEWAQRECTAMFYSYNQEAAAQFAGAAQNVVPEIMRASAHFVRVQRDASWLRRGYAEEVYLVRDRRPDPGVAPAPYTRAG